MIEFMQSAQIAAKEAGKLLTRRFHGDLKIEKKGQINLVTDVDRQSEKLIREIIRSEYPHHGFKAEEGLEDRSESEYLWLVDPLDGTTNYAHGFSIYCVSIALLKNGEIILGCIYNPTLDECFTAEADGGAYLNGLSISVSKTPRLDDSFLATGFPYDIRESDDDNLAEFSAFAKSSLAVRRAGSAALDLAYVACGRFDGFWEFKLAPWDIAAGILIIEEAGGKVTSYSGDKYNIYKGEVLASNSLIHEQMIDVLKRVRSS